MNRHKVFGIGFHKTATSSLSTALSMLGYRVTGPNGVHNPDIASDIYEMAKQLITEFDAFQDNPWPLLYRELDQWCPESKFILTIRPTEEWIKSVVLHFGSASTPMRQWIYGVGCPVGNEDIYVAKYDQHNKDVIDYFSDRPGDLLVLRVTEGEGWEKICPFLNRELPSGSFPDINKAADRKSPASTPEV